jgi:hypothetical protein
LPHRYGLAAHFKIYPLVYAPSFILLLDEEYDLNRTVKGVKLTFRNIFSYSRLLFTAVSGGIFLLLVAVFTK